MKTKNRLIIYLLAIFPMLLTGCGKDNDDYRAVNYPSHRDGVFAGDNLTVTLDGKAVTSVGSVTMKSSLLESNVDHEYEPGVVVKSNPTFTSTLQITGFPSANLTTTLETVTNFMEFKGTATINSVKYNYVGEFTGDPLMRHEFQGLILKFTTE